MYLFRLRQVLVAARGISLLAARKLLCCGMWTLTCGMQILSCGMHVGSSSLTRDQTQAPCIGSVESYPLGDQGSP